MLRKNFLLITGIPLMSIAVIAVLFVSTLDDGTFVEPVLIDSEERGRGLQPSGVHTFNMTGVSKVDPLKQDGELSDRYEKYGDIRIKIPSLLNHNLLVVENDNKDRVTILLSPEEITTETDTLNFLYNDNGIQIIVSALVNPETHGKDFWDTRLNDGFRYIDVTHEYRGVIQSQHSVEQHGETVHVRTTLLMNTDTQAINIQGFITDDLAKSIAKYIIKKEL